MPGKAFFIVILLTLMMPPAHSQSIINIKTDTGLLYNAPDGWAKSVGANYTAYDSPLLECTNHSLYTLYVFQLLQSAAPLDELAAQLHKAFFRPTASFSYQGSEQRMVKGINNKGNEYMYYEASVQDIITANNDHLYHYYMVYLERRGNSIVPVILSLKPFSYAIAARPLAVNGFFYGCTSLEKAWQLWVSSLRLPGTTTVSTISRDQIANTWKSTVHTGWTGLAGNQYSLENKQTVETLSLHTDGSFMHKLATKNAATGTFALQGNTLVLTDNAGRKDTYTVSIESIFQFGHWKKTLILTDNNNRTTTLNME